jgi:hypothetical protein
LQPAGAIALPIASATSQVKKRERPRIPGPFRFIANVMAEGQRPARAGSGQKLAWLRARG